MSRSKRRAPILGNILARSEKEDKVLAHRAARREARQIMGLIVDDADLPHPKKYGNPWLAAKDGKHWIRKDWFKPKLMRK